MPSQRTLCLSSYVRPRRPLTKTAWRRLQHPVHASHNRIKASVGSAARHVLVESGCLAAGRMNSKDLGGQALLHLSDLHFGCENPTALHALQALAAQLQPDVIVVTGDLTERATQRQFLAAKRFVAGLNCRHLVLLPGDRDLPQWAGWERLFWPARRFEVHFGPMRSSPVDLPWLRLVTADSVTRWRSADGALSPAECRRTADALASASPRQLRVVALHHPPLAAGGVLRGAAVAARCWDDAGVDLVLAGHVQQPDVTPLPGAPEHRPWLVTAGPAAASQALQSTLPGATQNATQNVKPSVNLIGHDAVDGCAWLQRWDFETASDAFAPGVLMRLPLTPVAKIFEPPQRRPPVLSAAAAAQRR